MPRPPEAFLPRRRAPVARKDDTFVDRFVAGFLRWRGLSSWLIAILAAVATAVGLAYKFSPRLSAFEARATMVEIHATLIDAKIDSIRQGTGFLFKKACLDLTQADQQFLGVTCPAAIYKGAPRTVLP